MEKEKRMAFVITQKGNTTTFITIGDESLKGELRDYVFREIQELIAKSK